MKALLKLAAVAALAMAVTSAAACSGGSKSSPTTSKSSTSAMTSRASTTTTGTAAPADYTGLLIKASDINAPEAFIAAVPINNPNGQVGATTTFSNSDRTHVIVDSIQVLADPAAAAAALKAAKGSTDGYVHGVPEPTAIGAGGTTISGPSPDGAKGVTVVMFTEGKAFVELEFDGPPDSLVPPDFVNDVAQKQDAAIKKGLTN
ncbi:hypothetical protein MRAB57_4631 [Mycobacterium rhizamassiliense]|jgi:hypothetical protein|uniref:Lipoprotein LpqN n=1 Tax=Mycobacterium rhizamassiliense TaxID=1841860 RepID=A0A2U3NZ56_9MYCO|nr:hypothetical protein [Mycobacterium rhizamassiliense]SPM36790.1 hypothetical protein MRAB57_4631 [Mycobacterium rhizamassiliense]